MDDTQVGGFQSSLTAHEKKKVTIKALKMGYMTNLSATRPEILYPRSARILWLFPCQFKNVKTCSKPAIKGSIVTII